MISNLIYMLFGILLIFFYFWGTEHNIIALIFAILLFLFGLVCSIFKQKLIRNIVNALFFILLGLSFFILYLCNEEYKGIGSIQLGSIFVLIGIISLILALKSKKD